MKWVCCRLDDLTPRQIWSMYHIRCETFCVQQKRIFLDPDQTDLTAFHVLGINEQNHLVAYARFYPEQDHLSFGRVLTVPSVRGTGIGKLLMDKLLIAIKSYNVDQKDIVITAQADKQGFYERFGFVPQGDVFIHEQTPHLMMKRQA